ncbi:MAG: hypothetical protein M3Q30_05310 [Actinomycetota bacterium]|nr:hypothetical protein [Actinomycetota bacterium]
MRRSAVTVLGVAASLVLALTATAAPGVAANTHGESPGQLRRQPANAHCDPIDTTQCLTPFPDDFFTVRDATSPTGRRVHFSADVMPVNSVGVPIDPTDWNHNDGFSPGSEIIVNVPGINLATTGAASITDIARSLDPDAPIVLLDTTTGRRVPYWAELDTWNHDQPTRALVIRPARNFGEAHHIVVALRNMKDASGNTIAATPAFQVFRDHRPSVDPAVSTRRKAMDRILAQLEGAGVRRRSLYLAWDFTVASQQGLSGRMLHMRDHAYAALGAGVPAFHVASVDESPNASIARRVQGTFDVPLYLTNGGAPGGRMPLDDQGMPIRTGTFHAAFRCLIPASAAAGGTAHPGRGVAYGHGLLGSTSEIEGFAPFLDQYDIVLCATPEIGMASDDVPNVLNVISNLSTFGSIPDRLQQGMLNMQFLARLLKDPRGFGNDPAFRFGAPASSSIVPNEVFYNGNSQGGIFGGAATAISKEWTRAVLGVPGMNYSELLPRSVDFDPFLPLLSASYPDEGMHILIVAMNQILWDRGDPNGYAQHMIRDPYPGTPNHQVLMIEAFGDHQVANISTETEARTIGAFVHQPAIASGRSNDVTPMWDIPPVPSSPFGGSVLQLWDFGTPAPPIESLPPESPQYGDDPHGAARNVAAVRDEVSLFLHVNGTFVDECGAQPCHP